MTRENDEDKCRFTVEDAIGKMVDALCSDAAWWVNGPTSGYRCKATYSLYPSFSTSQLVSNVVNSVCSSVNDFRVSSPFSLAHPKFFFEVLAKVNRSGGVLVKIVFFNERVSLMAQDGHTLWDEWLKSGEQDQLVLHLRHSYSLISSIIAHVDVVPTGQKPTKKSSYISLIQSGCLTITEQTPSGKEYVLSSDSFCEVNHAMEEEIFSYLCSVLSLHSRAPATSSLFLSGRDILAMFKSLEEFYSFIQCSTTCSSVYEDSRINNISLCQLVEKNQIHQLLKEFYHSRQGKKDIVMTAGRHGLHPSTLVSLVNLASILPSEIDNFIYISCNKESLKRDFFVLKEGYRMRSVSTFNFFPGTSYVMTVVQWKPLTVEYCNGCLLVLPIGPPGSGKSVCGRALQECFSRRDDTADVCCRRSSDLTEGYCWLDPGIAKEKSIPRKCLHVDSALDVEVVERDRIFKDFREQGVSLKKAKRETHSSLIFRLLARTSYRRLLYLDSTNGRSEGRAAHIQQWLQGYDCEMNAGGHIHVPSFLELWFACSDSDILLERVQSRLLHPSFPTEEIAQRKKLMDISSSMEVPNFSKDSTALVVNNTATEKETVERVLFIVAAFLYCDHHIALSLYHVVFP